MKSELSKLYDQIESVKVAMMTTRRPDGHLESRAMATQRQADGADLWFVTMEGSAKVRDLTHDPHVNLAYYQDGSREWVSVSGTAELTRDRKIVEQLYASDWKVWFPDRGDPRDGTPDDPRIMLIGVTVHAATFLEIDEPYPVVLYEMAKGWLTGSMPDVGEMHEVSAPRRPRVS